MLCASCACASAHRAPGGSDERARNRRGKAVPGEVVWYNEDNGLGVLTSSFAGFHPLVGVNRTLPRTPTRKAPRVAYTAKDITVLKGLEPVRERPGMYIGSTGPSGLHHLVYEVVDNSVDEAMAGEATRIDTTFLADGGWRAADHR